MVDISYISYIYFTNGGYFIFLLGIYFFLTHRNSGFSHEKWWIFPYSYVSLPEGIPIEVFSSDPSDLSDPSDPKKASGGRCPGRQTPCDAAAQPNPAGAEGGLGMPGGHGEVFIIMVIWL